MPVPLWVKRILDRWLAEAAIAEGPLFRTLRKGGALDPKVQPMSEDLVYTLVRQERRRDRPSGVDAARPAEDVRETVPESGRGFRADSAALGPCLDSDDGAVSRDKAGSRPGRQRSGQDPRGVKTVVSAT